MGLARGAISLLMEESKRRPFSGRIATLGRQSVLVSSRELSVLFQKFSLIPKIDFTTINEKMDDEILLKALGFAEVHSFDYSDYEGTTHVFDLNSDKLPETFANRYDVVLDSGTIEHVFHIPNVLKNIFHMTKVGGRVIFLSPSSNHVDHGFYMFSPTFFFDYYSANGFTIKTIYVIRYDLDQNEPWDIYEYRPGDWQNVSLGGLDSQPYAIFVVAIKTEASTWNVVPQQGFYADNAAIYSGSTVASLKRSPSVENHRETNNDICQKASVLPGKLCSLMPLIKSLVKRIPGAILLVHHFRRWMAKLRAISLLMDGSSSHAQRKNLGKKLITRY